MLKKIYGAICRAEVAIAGATFAISCVIIFASAVARTLKQPFNWAQDLSLFLFAWSVFLSADAALRNDKLMRIELLTDRLKPRARQLLEMVNYLIILAFLVALAYYGVKLSIFSWRRSFQGIPGVSYSWVTLSLPFGAVLLSVTVILKLRDVIARLRGAPERGGA